MKLSVRYKFRPHAFSSAKCNSNIRVVSTERKKLCQPCLNKYCACIGIFLLLHIQSKWPLGLISLAQKCLSSLALARQGSVDTETTLSTCLYCKTSVTFVKTPWFVWLLSVHIYIVLCSTSKVTIHFYKISWVDFGVNTSWYTIFTYDDIPPGRTYITIWVTGYGILNLSHESSDFWILAE